MVGRRSRASGPSPSRSRKTRKPKKLGDPTASPTYKKILSVLESKEKIPSVSKIGEHYYNFWTSAENPRGLLRRVASLDEFRKKEPAWEVVLDVDKLGKDEGQSWVYKGSASCREYDSENKPIKSPGGHEQMHLAVAGRLRRHRAPRVRPGDEEICRGQGLPPRGSKQVRCSWVDKDTIFLGADLGQEGDMTSSGYPRRVREVEARHGSRRSTCRLRR